MPQFKACRLWKYMDVRRKNSQKPERMEVVMLNRYIYKGEDITLDIIMKIEHVVRLIGQKSGNEFDECLYEFYKSRVYEALIQTGSLMWSESAEFIVDEFFREKSFVNKL